ncbi:MAG: UDP-glucose 4-epimerase GalE [Alphaproteobacteria bacterium]
MTVLVTGGAGYIGGHMALALRDRGEAVVVLDNLTTGHRWSVPDGAELVVGDAGDPALVAQVIADHQIDAVAHFAGSIVVPDSVADPLEYYRNNTVVSRALMAAVVKAGVRNMIFSSTAAVYGAPAHNPVAEDAPLQPISPYGTSKLMTEWMLRDTAAAHDFAYAALRYFNVSGADPQGRAGQSTPRATHLIKIACKVALGERPMLDIFGTDYDTPDGTCIRDYIHVTDLANAHLLALDHLRGGGKSIVYNCGYGRGFSVREVIGAVERACASPLSVHEAPRRAGDPPALVAGADAIRRDLGWSPTYDDIDAIVTHALAWEKSLADRNIAT